MNIGQLKVQLDTLMEFKNLKRNQLAKMMGVSPTTLNVFLLGGNTRRYTIEKMIRFLEDHYDRMTKLERDE